MCIPISEILDKQSHFVCGENVSHNSRVKLNLSFGQFFISTPALLTIEECFFR